MRSIRAGKKVKRSSPAGDARKHYAEWWDNAPVAYHILDTEGKVLQVNKTEARMLGYSRKEMIGRKIFEFILPEQQREAEKRFKMKLSGKSLPKKEDRLYVRKDGTRFFVSIQDVLEKDADEKVIGVRTTMIDVTERKKAEEALRESEKQTRAINALLSLSNKVASRKEYLDAVIKHLQSINGYKYIGIRILNEEGEIPYESYAGFNHRFWEAESRLSTVKDQCICIRVIKDSPDLPDKSGMTKRGSFQCNNLAKFFSHLDPLEQKRFRFSCLRYGFNSMAVVPIRFNDEILGAIHVADKKEGQLPAAHIEFIESLAPTLGEVINKFNAADELRKSNELLIESYKYLGVINRKISLLLELEKHQKRKKREVAEYILNSAMNLAQADAGLLYSFNEGKNRFFLISDFGLPAEKRIEARKVTGKSCALLQKIVKSPKRLQGSPQELSISSVPLAENMKYILSLPLVRDGKLKGVVLLEFLRKKNMDLHELEFFDIFSMHASVALANAGVFR